MLDRADKNIIWEQDHLWLLHLLCKVTLSPFSLIFSQLEILSQLVFPAVPPRCSCLGLQRSCQTAESKISKGLGKHPPSIRLTNYTFTNYASDCPIIPFSKPAFPRQHLPLQCQPRGGGSPPWPPWTSRRLSSCFVRHRFPRPEAKGWW